MKRRGRLYVEASKSVDKNKLYTPEEAVKLVKSLSKRKFDETVEVAMNLNVDTTKSDQQVRRLLIRQPKSLLQQLQKKVLLRLRQ